MDHLEKLENEKESLVNRKNKILNSFLYYAVSHVYGSYKENELQCLERQIDRISAEIRIAKKPMVDKKPERYKKQCV